MKPTRLCLLCGSPYVPARSSAYCPKLACQKKAAAERTRLYKIRKKIKAKARQKWRQNETARAETYHLPLAVKLKVIQIELIALEVAKQKHSQAPLPQEQDAADSLEAIRRLSESTNR